MSTISLSQNKRIDMPYRRTGLHKNKENVEFKSRINSELKKNTVSPLESTSNSQVSFKGVNFRRIGKGVKGFIKGIDKEINPEYYKYIRDKFYLKEKQNHIVAFWDKHLYNSDSFNNIKIKRDPLSERFLNIFKKDLGEFFEDVIRLKRKPADQKSGKEDAEKQFKAAYSGIKHLMASLKRPKAHKELLKRLKTQEWTSKSIGELVEDCIKKNLISPDKEAELRKLAPEYVQNGGKQKTKSLKYLFLRCFKDSTAEEKALKTLTKNQRSQLLKDPINFNSSTFATVNRIVSGLVSAIFVSRDFFNYSMFLKNDPEAAKKESRSKFKQELYSRVGLTAFFNYMTMSLLKEQCNASLKTSVLVGVGTTALAEVLGRKLAGRKVLPTIRFKNKKKNKDVGTSTTDNNNTSSKKAKNVAFAGKVNLKMIKDKLPKDLVDAKLDLLANIAEGAKDSINKKYFLKEGEHYYLGLNGKASVGKKIVDSVFFPVKWGLNLGKEAVNVFAPNTFNTEKYKDIARAKVLLGLVDDAIKSSNVKIDGIEAEKIHKLFESGNEKELAKKIRNLLKPENKDALKLVQEEYGRLHGNKINSDKSFDASKLGSYNKVLGSALAAGFYALDVWNLSMKDSNGDYNASFQKVRERVVQDSTRVGISSWFVAASNSLFSKWNNGSIFGAATLTAGNVSAYESATRLSVGMPLRKHNQKELIEIDEKHRKQKGPLGTYYKVMSRLTGKKPLSAKIKNNEPPQMPLYASNLNNQVDTSNTSLAAKEFYKHFKSMSADTTKVDDKLVPTRFKRAINQN